MDAGAVWLLRAIRCGFYDAHFFAGNKKAALSDGFFESCLAAKKLILPFGYHLMLQKSVRFVNTIYRLIILHRLTLLDRQLLRRRLR